MAGTLNSQDINVNYGTSRVKIDFTTTAGGAFDVQTTNGVIGLLVGIKLIGIGAAGAALDDGATWTLHDADGLLLASGTYAAATPTVLTPDDLGGGVSHWGKLTLAVAAGGNAQRGLFIADFLSP